MSEETYPCVMYHDKEAPKGKKFDLPMDAEDRADAIAELEDQGWTDSPAKKAPQVKDEKKDDTKKNQSKKSGEGGN